MTVSVDPSAEGLRLDQAPPLSIPLRFFLSAPIFLVGAGGLLAASGGAIVVSRYMNATIAFTHLLTLGVLTMTMFGALYQMTPVVAAAPVPKVSFARVVHGALVLGLLCFVYSIVAFVPLLMHVAISFITLSWLGFAIPVLLALGRSPAAAEATVRGMRLALVSALLVWFLGVWIAHGHAGARFPGPRPTFMAVHLGLGLLGFVGALLTAVSFQVLPMFYLAPPLDEAHKRLLLRAVALSVLVASVGLALSMVVSHEQAAVLGEYLPLSFAPAGCAVWVALPVLTLRALSRRKRKRADASLRFWRLGLGLAPVTGALAVASLLGDDPRVELAFGYVALVGWALAIVHGMLYRIVPFLVWFHRFSQLVGLAPVPSAAKLMPESWPRLAFALHVAALAIGTAAIGLRSELLARLTGVLICALAAQLLRALVHLARRFPEGVRLQN